MTALPLPPLPSRDDDDAADADRRAYLASIPTAELVLPGSAGAATAAPLAAQPSIDVADLHTLEMVPPHIEASIPWRLLSFAEKHEEDAARDRREARRFRAKANDMEGNLDRMRGTLARYVARRDTLLGYSIRSEADTAHLRHAEDRIIQLDQEIADLRLYMIKTREGARRLEEQAIKRDGLAERCRRAARAESNGRGRA